ncbi:MAG TPA: single-stranded DNA-binding protein [Armatimonadota bacterium]|jgi:single-strand DNA-binding protein
MNRIILIGRLATDPELKYTPSGVAVTDFRLAVDRPWKNASGEKETDFVTVKVWREQAEHVANYLQKGRQAAVDGRLEIRTWVAQDGTKRSAAEVVAERVQFLDRPREGDSGGAARDQEAPPAYGQRAAQSFAERPAAAPAATSAPTTEEPDFGDPFADQ